MTDRVPNFFVAGVPKAGTSSVHAWLADHPQALGAPIKETCYFADPGSHVYRDDFNAAMGLDTYAQAFPEPRPDTRVIFESTPSYIYSRTALDRIPALSTAPRCLFVLREPASQIRSLYTYFRNNWSYVPPDMSFAAFVDAVRRGSHDFGGNELARDALAHADYLRWLGPWRDRLGPGRMKIATFDALIADPMAFMQDLARWLGIDPDFFADYEFRQENETYEPKNRTLQRLNVALRGRLPKGRLYDAARTAYRRLNTRRPAPDGDRAMVEALRLEFRQANADLARAFDLDLSGW